jgi:hypothetical protein
MAACFKFIDIRPFSSVFVYCDPIFDLIYVFYLVCTPLFY